MKRFLLILLAACVGSSAYAENSVGELRVHVNRRGAVLDRQRPGAIGEASIFSVQLQAGRSYECALYSNNTSTTGSSPDVRFDIGNITDGTSNTLLISERGAASPPVNNDGASAIRDAGRVTIIPPVDAIYRLPYLTTFDGTGTWPSGTGDFTLWAECNETTLYGGFNTFVNNFNFLELTNTSNVTVDGSIRTVDFAGNVLMNDVPFSVLPGRRTDFDIHSQVGPQKYGTVIVKHNAPRGSLLAYMSQYKGSAADFNLVVSLPFVTQE